ncbi:MAG: YveK family protein, partial [Rubrobacteraceae bacterium]
MITDSENNAYREETKDEYVLSLGELLGVVWKRFWIILLVTIVFMGMAAGFSFIEEPEYQASIKILVGQESEDSEEASALGGAVQGLQDVTLTMAEAVETRSVAEEVIERLDLQMPPGDFLTQLDSEPVPNTQFIEVTYTDGNPEEASRVANTIGEVFSERVSDISPNAVTATVWD